MGRWRVSEQPGHSHPYWVLDPSGFTRAHFHFTEDAEDYARERNAADDAAVAAEEQADSGDHLDFVNVVEVTEGQDHWGVMHALGERHDADRLVAAMNEGSEPDDDHPALYTLEVKGGDDAERLIASVRGDVLEGMGKPNLAKTLRRGVAPADLLGQLVASLEDVRLLLQRWAEEDEARFVPCARCGTEGCDPSLERRPGEGVICDECRDGEEAEAEPYTVVGLLPDGNRWQRWANTYEATSVADAERQARAEENGVEIAAVFAQDIGVNDLATYSDEEDTQGGQS